MDEKKTEVLIVGAGPVGLLGALALARDGVGVQIVDTGVWATTHSYALALHPQSLELLRDFGLMSDVLENAYPVRKVAFYEGAERRAEIIVGDRETSLAVLRQDVLENLLEKALKDHGVEVSWRHEVTSLEPRPAGVEATIAKYEQESRGYVVAHTEWVVSGETRLSVPYVIGADGYKSRVRRAMKVDFPEVGPAQYFAVFEFKSNFDLENEMRVVFSGGTTNVLWPLPNGYCRWSFQLPNYVDPEVERMKEFYSSTGKGSVPSKRPKDRKMTAEAEYPQVLEAAKLRLFIAERAPWFVGSVDDVTWRTVVRFEKRLVGRFGQDRLWLAGDAAHLTGPVGVQSMNAGLFEARDLASRLSVLLRTGAGSAGLSEYNRTWTAEWRRLHGLEGGLRPLPAAGSWVTAHTDSLLACLPAHGSALNQLAAQLNLQA